MVKSEVEIQCSARAPDGSENPLPPASPSHSWSSSETLLAPSQQPLADERSEGGRPKRCKISHDQLVVLIKTFEEEPLPNFDQRQAMAKHLGMAPRSVQIWFQNRRQRLKPISKSFETNLAAQAAVSASHQQHSQQFGMPCLAASAGLFGSGLIPSAAHLPAHEQGATTASVQPLLSYAVMEPFAATKALLGAGYQHASVLNLGMRYAHGGAVCNSQALEVYSQEASSIDLARTPITHFTFATAVDSDPDRTSPSSTIVDAPPTVSAAATTTTSASSASDGLLLLLACAGGGAPERPGGDPYAAARSSAISLG